MSKHNRERRRRPAGADPFTDPEGWKRQVDENLRGQRGEAWVEANRAGLDASWEFLKQHYL